MTKDYKFDGLKALFINASIKKDSKESHTLKLINRAAGIMREHRVDVEILHLLDYDVAFGMEKDLTKSGADKDDWPQIQKKIMAADIFVLGTPIWLGVKSSVATLVIERMYAYSGDHNDKDQYLYYGKTGGCVVTGNEDGIKHCSMDILYALQHIGYMVPPQADCGWIGEAGPGPSYGDTEWNGKKLPVPLGYDNDFTNRNCTFMAYNLMHTAKMLKDAGGIPAYGNTTSDWEHVTNAKTQNPEYIEEIVKYTAMWQLRLGILIYMKQSQIPVVDSAYLAKLAKQFAAIKDSAELYKAIVNAPFVSKTLTTSIDLGIVVLLLVDKKSQSIERVALSDTVFADSAVEVSAKPFHDIKIPMHTKGNSIAEAIDTGQSQITEDWQSLFVPVLTPEQSRRNQHQASIECSQVRPLGKNGAMIFSFYQPMHTLGKEHNSFTQQYADFVTQQLQIHPKSK